MRRYVFTLFMFSFLGLNSCQNASAVANLLSLSKSVLDLVHSYMILHKDFATYTSEVITTTSENLQPKENKLPKIPAVARYFEFHWNKIEDKYASLTNRLQEIKVTSDQYFNLLESNNTSISDTTLRRMDYERNELKKQKWNQQYNKTVDDLKKAKPLIIKGRDWVKIVANAAARNELDSLIKEIEQISFIVTFSLPSNVKDFEKNAKTIFDNE